MAPFSRLILPSKNLSDFLASSFVGVADDDGVNGVRFNPVLSYGKLDNFSLKKNCRLRFEHAFYAQRVAFGSRSEHSDESAEMLKKEG